MTAFAAAAAELHADPDLSVAATYTPPGGSDPVALRVILSERDAAEIGVIVRESTASVLLTDVAAPAVNATLAVGAKTRTGRAVERDVEGTAWTLVLRG